jgi:hypothetical protein
MLGVYIEQFGITKVVIQLLVPEVYTEQCGNTKAVIHRLVPEVYTEHFGISKVVSHTPSCAKSLYRTVRYT